MIRRVILAAERATDGQIAAALFVLAALVVAAMTLGGITT